MSQANASAIELGQKWGLAPFPPTQLAHTSTNAGAEMAACTHFPSATYFRHRLPGAAYDQARAGMARELATQSMMSQTNASAIAIDQDPDSGDIAPGPAGDAVTGSPARSGSRPPPP